MFLRRGEQGEVLLRVRREETHHISVTSAVGSPPTRGIRPSSAPSAATPLATGISLDEAPNDLDPSGRDACWTHPFRALQALCHGSDHGSGRDGKSGCRFSTGRRPHLCGQRCSLVGAGGTHSTDGRWQATREWDRSQPGWCLRAPLYFTYLQPGQIIWTEITLENGTLVTPDGVSLGEIKSFGHEAENGEPAERSS